jgi:hypothetical protein
MGNRAGEHRVFAGFLAEAPLFAGSSVVDWRQPLKDPPDIECDLADGRKIGVELTSWLDESQIGSEKWVESVETSLRDAIQPEPPNQTEHIRFVWLAPKRRMVPADGAAFRAELLTLIEEVEKRWESEADWQSPQGFLWKDFTRYPTLAKYLNSLDVHPRMPSAPSTMRKGGIHWLTFPAPGGAYSPDSMVDALVEVVEAKVAKYTSKPPGMDEFHLLVHYDKALLYNSPVHGIDFGYADAVRAASKGIGSAAGVFSKILVFVPIAEGEQVFQLYP